MALWRTFIDSSYSYPLTWAQRRESGLRYLGMSLLDFEAERKRGMRGWAHGIIYAVGLIQLQPLFGNSPFTGFYIRPVA